MKIFGRDPSLIIGAVVAAISLAGTLGFSFLGPDQAGAWIAVVNLAAGAALAYTVRPIQPAAFTYFIGALAALGAAYGLSFSAETVNGLNGLVIGVLTLLTYGNVSPVDTALTLPSRNPTLEAARKIYKDDPSTTIGEVADGDYA